jgi:hypothetical protein
MAKRINQKIFSYLLIFFLIFFVFSQQVKAVCPVCTIAVAGGIELSRWFKVDDTISGVWIGGLIVSLSLWLIDWLKKKNIKFIFDKILVFIAFYIIVVLPLYWMKFIGLPNCAKLWGYDKLIVGIVFGSIAFAIGFWLNNWLKKRNNNKVYFPFQKVVLPILFLIIASVIFYFITKC